MYTSFIQHLFSVDLEIHPHTIKGWHAIDNVQLSTAYKDVMWEISKQKVTRPLRIASEKSECLYLPTMETY